MAADQSGDGLSGAATSGTLSRPSAGILDSQSVKTTDSGSERGYDGHKKVKGRKRHVLVDTLGNLLEVVVLAANCTDVSGAKAVLTKVERQIALRLLKLWADQGYQGEWSVWLHEQFAIQLEIVSAQPDQVGLPSNHVAGWSNAPLLGWASFAV